jgi:hypothetical protein
MSVAGAKKRGKSKADKATTGEVVHYDIEYGEPEGPPGCIALCGVKGQDAVDKNPKGPFPIFSFDWSQVTCPECVTKKPITNGYEIQPLQYLLEKIDSNIRWIEEDAINTDRENLKEGYRLAMEQTIIKLNEAKLWTLKMIDEILGASAADREKQME